MERTVPNSANKDRTDCSEASAGRLPINIFFKIHPRLVDKPVKDLANGEPRTVVVRGSL